MPIEQDAKDYVDTLIATYFSDPQFRVKIEAGEVLMRQGEPNDRLYVLLSGSLRAEQQSSTGKTTELFQAKSRHFVGVYSFFSETYSSMMTFTAQEDSILAFLDRDRFFQLRKNGDPLFERFMPVVVTELVSRYRQTQDLTIAREKTFLKLLETEKIASLGQMAAGVAHELNNAISVLARNGEWVSDTLDEVFDRQNLSAFYQAGVREGYVLSSRDKRQRRNALVQKFGLDVSTAEKLVGVGVDVETYKQWHDDLDTCHDAWKVGAALHDMLVAAKHATHVVRSMKALGAASKQNVSALDVNETIQDALTLSHGLCDQLEVVLDLGEVPLIHAQAGDLVQVWLNLIKNACESMARVMAPRLEIKSLCIEDAICVSITDCGTGIPSDILPNIFQPNVTTKVDGLSFGLGLGLTIVQRQVHALCGKVLVESYPGRTTFEVHLPLEGKQ